VTLGALIRGARALQHAVEDWHALHGVTAAKRVAIVDDLDAAATPTHDGVILSADVTEHVGLVVRSSSTGAATIEWLLDGERVAFGFSEATGVGTAVESDRRRQGRL